MAFSFFRKKDPEADIPTSVGNFVDVMHNPSQERKAEAMLQRVTDQCSDTAESTALVLQKSDMVWGDPWMVTRVTSQDIDWPVANLEPWFNEPAGILTTDSYIEVKVVNNQSPLKSLVHWRDVFTVKSLKEIYDTLSWWDKSRFMSIIQFRKYWSEWDWYDPNDRWIFKGTNGITLNLWDLLTSPHMWSLKNKTA